MLGSLAAGFAAGLESGWPGALGLAGDRLSASIGLTSWLWLAAAYGGAWLVPGSRWRCGVAATACFLAALTAASLLGGLVAGLLGGAGEGSLVLGLLVALSAWLGGLPLALFSGLAALVLGGRLQGLAAGFLGYVVGGALTVFTAYLLGAPLDVVVAVNPLLASDNLPETLYLAFTGGEPFSVPLASAVSAAIAVAALVYALYRVSVGGGG